MHEKCHNDKSLCSNSIVLNHAYSFHLKTATTMKKTAVETRNATSIAPTTPPATEAPFFLDEGSVVSIIDSEGVDEASGNRIVVENSTEEGAITTEEVGEALTEAARGESDVDDDGKMTSEDSDTRVVVGKTNTTRLDSVVTAVIIGACKSDVVNISCTCVVVGNACDS